MKKPQWELGLKKQRHALQAALNKLYGYTAAGGLVVQISSASVASRKLQNRHSACDSAFNSPAARRFDNLGALISLNLRLRPNFATRRPEIRRLRNQVLFERVFDAVNAGLRAHFVLVTGAAANTDSAYLHVVCCHDRQSTRECNDSGNQGQSGHGAPF